MTLNKEEFKTLVMLSEKLMRHAALMMLMLPDETENPLPAEIKSKAENRAEQLLAALPETFGFAIAKEKCEEMNISERTLKRWLKAMVENKQIVRIEKGEYKKL